EISHGPNFQSEWWPEFAALTSGGPFAIERTAHFSLEEHVMAGSRDQAIQEMLDKHAIREVIYRYCRGVDPGDVELLSSCYHHDAYDDHAGRIFNGLNVAQGLVDWMKDIMESTNHNITTNVIEVNGDRAAAESYTTSMHIQTIDGETKLLL